MTIRFWIIIITIILIYNIYHDNSLFKNINKYKKFYKMGIVIVFAFGAMGMINKGQSNSYQTMKSLHEFINVMPIDRQSKDILTPFFQRTTPSPYEDINNPTESIRRLNSSGKKSTKRSVSETKKKYVASQQNWKCKHCQKQLSAWFEVDHVQRLEYGGSNEVSNLEALCRECHGKKTSMENM